MALSQRLQDGWALLQPFRSCKTFIIIAVASVMAIDGVIFGFGSSVIPFLLQDANFVNKSQAQLHTSLLLATFSAADFFGAPLCALYVDRTKFRREAWFFGICLLAIGIVLFGTSVNVAMLYLSQLFLGASSGILYTICLAVLVEAVEPHELATWVATVMSFSTFGVVVGPVVGGAAYEHAPHGKLAVTCMSLGLMTLALVFLVLTKQPGRGEEDCLARKESMTMFSMNGPSAPEPKVFRWKNLGLLLKSRRLLAAIWGVVLFEFITTGIGTILGLRVQKLFDWNSTYAGAAFIAIAGASFIGWPAGRLTDHYGARKVAVAGFVLSVPALCFLGLVDQNSESQQAALILLLFLSAITTQLFLCSLGAEFSLVTDDVCEKTGYELRATSFCLLNGAIAMGGVVGPLTTGPLEDLTSWKWVMMLLGGVCLLGAVPCAYFTGNKVEESFRADIRTVPKKLKALVIRNKHQETASMRKI